MLPVRSYRDLEVWQEAMVLAELCYKRTSSFPNRETYGLLSQIRRAAVSVPSNIAEGHSRRSLAVYLNHISIALGSLAELETQIELSQRFSYLSESEAREVLDPAGRVGRRLHALMRSLADGKRSVPPISRVQRVAPSPQHPAPRSQQEVTD